MEARNPITWNFVGLCENALGHTRESVIAYERATQLDPTFKEAWANMAQVRPLACFPRVGQPSGRVERGI
jgi:cytochrome c-type biogenesis protein CcmH/NrfG